MQIPQTAHGIYALAGFTAAISEAYEQQRMALCSNDYTIKIFNKINILHIYCAIMTNTAKYQI